MEDCHELLDRPDPPTSRPAESVVSPPEDGDTSPTTQESVARRTQENNATLAKQKKYGYAEGKRKSLEAEDTDHGVTRRQVYHVEVISAPTLDGATEVGS